jgi:hypothetical protein
MAENSVLYTAVYSDVNVALADLETLEDLHEDEVIGKYDAAVVDKENGEPHIVKRVDRPRIRVIPELLGSGTLPRRDLKDAAQELGSDQAALIVIGEPTLEKGFDKAVSKADKIVKRDVDVAADQLASEVNEASKEE